MGAYQTEPLTSLEVSPAKVRVCGSGPIISVGTPAVWLRTVKTLRVRTAADADLGNVDAGCPQPGVSLGDIGHAPRQAPQSIRPVADPGLQIVRDLDDEIAAAEEEEARTPLAGSVRSSRRLSPRRPA